MAIALREHTYAGYHGYYAVVVVGMQAATGGGSCWEAEKIKSPGVSEPFFAYSVDRQHLLVGRDEGRSGEQRAKELRDDDASLGTRYRYACYMELCETENKLCLFSNILDIPGECRKNRASGENRLIASASHDKADDKEILNCKISIQDAMFWLSTVCRVQQATACFTRG